MEPLFALTFPCKGVFFRNDLRVPVAPATGNEALKTSLLGDLSIYSNMPAINPDDTALTGDKPEPSYINSSSTGNDLDAQSFRITDTEPRLVATVSFSSER